MTPVGVFLGHVLAFLADDAGELPLVVDHPVILGQIDRLLVADDRGGRLEEDQGHGRVFHADHDPVVLVIDSGADDLGRPVGGDEGDLVLGFNVRAGVGSGKVKGRLDRLLAGRTQLQAADQVAGQLDRRLQLRPDNPPPGQHRAVGGVEVDHLTVVETNQSGQAVDQHASDFHEMLLCLSGWTACTISLPMNHEL